jgi:hypothetical protein
MRLASSMKALIMCVLAPLCALKAKGQGTNSCTPTGPAKSVLTQLNNNCRTGANLSETTLHTSNVDAVHFAKLAAIPVDGYVFAQPLYYPNLVVNGTTHNVVFVATFNDSIYAFDADNFTTLWHTSVGIPLGKFEPPTQSCGNGIPPDGQNVLGCVVGVVSTPVIDPSTNILYCAKVDSAATWWLVGLNIATGQVARVAEIGTSVSGFNPANELQRPALLLSSGNLYIAFGAYNDAIPAAGYILAYRASDFTFLGSQPTVSGLTQLGSIWQSGRGPVASQAGNVFFETGNANGATYTGNAYSSSSILAEGVVEVNSSAESPQIYQPNYPNYYPNPAVPPCYNKTYCDNPKDQDAKDFDLASSGPMLLPRTSLLLAGGKMGISYLLNTSNLAAGSIQRFRSAGDASATSNFELHSVSYWDRSTGGQSPLFYVWGVGDVLRSYTFNFTRQVFSTTPVKGPTTAQFPGGTITLSANGDAAGSGIVWGTYTTTGGNQQGPPQFIPVPGILAAYDASNVSRLLYSSSQVWSNQPLSLGQGDSLVDFAKFTPVTVANGKVFIPTLTPTNATNPAELLVYGLLQPDILAVVKNNTGTNTTEVHELTAASNYSQFGLHTGTALHTTDSTWNFTTADLDLDGRPELVAIAKQNTGTGKTEAHALGAYCSGVSGYFQGYVLHTPTALGPTDSSWEFQMADIDQDGLPDLVAIHKWGTSSGKTEVTVMKGLPVGTCSSPSSASFQTVIWQGATGLGTTSTNWTFRLADIDGDGHPDLVGIEESGTASGKTELHVLSGAPSGGNYFQTSVLDVATGLGPTSSTNWDFQMADLDRDGKPDLYGIFENGTGSGMTEVHVLSGASNYQSFILEVATGLHATDNNWVFLGIPWSCAVGTSDCPYASSGR